MQNKISGTFNGTGAALYLGIGFIPDWVNIHNLEDGNFGELRWSINSRSLEQIEGVLYTDGVPSALTFGNGVAIYRGGDYLTAASTAYLIEDPSKDKRDGNAGIAGTIKSWTLDTAGNRTGHFNAEASTTYVGEGSRIAIRPSGENTKVKFATILAMTSNGEVADEVTLNEAIQSGTIEYLSGMYDMIGAAAGTTMPAGFVINATSVINVSGELCYFEAGIYGNDVI